MYISLIGYGLGKLLKCYNVVNMVKCLCSYILESFKFYDKPAFSYGEVFIIAISWKVSNSTINLHSLLNLFEMK